MNRGTLTVVVVVGLLSTVAFAPVATAQTDEPEGALIAELHEDGSATVTVQLVYRLDRDSDREAFRSLQDSAAERTELASRFRDRMGRVADAMASETNRDVSIGGATIDLSTADDGTVGLVELSVDWDGFAARTDDGLTVSRPFAGDFESDRAIVIVGPSGYEPGTVRPSPTTTDGRMLRWAADANLDGFRVTFHDAETAGGSGSDGASGDGTDSSGGMAPGFGPVVGVLALIIVGALARRRGFDQL